MSTSLVGYTGFVGSNLAKSYFFDNLFNSVNIEKSFGSKPELLVYSGVPAEKYLANRKPEEDYNIIKNAIENIKKIAAKRVVLISTIDVYKNPADVDEDTPIDTVGLHPYGLNRYYLEKWVFENIDDCLIVRLPGLYGDNIRKNFIFDLINIIPSMLSDEKYIELSRKSRLISENYLKQPNGFYKCVDLDSKKRKELKECFNSIGFSAINFTDSRASYQFYNLKYLWAHIEIALQNNINKLNIATQPVKISELYKYIKAEEFINEFSEFIPNYNFRTIYADLFNGKAGYIFDKAFIMKDIKDFVDKMV